MHPTSPYAFLQYLINNGRCFSTYIQAAEYNEGDNDKIESHHPLRHRPSTFPSIPFVFSISWPHDAVHNLAEYLIRYLTRA